MIKFINNMASKSKIIKYDEFQKSVGNVLLGLPSIGITNLTNYQTEALYNFISGHDTFAVLPTGHGKSLVYQMSVLVTKEMKLNYRPVIVVVSPLNALIADQIKECKRFGLLGYKLESSNIETLHNECKYEIIFSSPEVLECFPAKILLQKLESRIIGIVVDESHCVVKW